MGFPLTLIIKQAAGLASGTVFFPLFRCQNLASVGCGFGCEFLQNIGSGSGKIARIRSCNVKIKPIITRVTLQKVVDEDKAKEAAAEKKKPPKVQVELTQQNA